MQLESSVTNNPVALQMAQMMQAMVAEAGFDVSLKATEFATLLDEETAGKYQIARTDWSGRVDPDGNIHQFLTCKGGINDTKYCNPEVDKLLNEARTSTDNAARKEKYDAATAILTDELPVIYFGHQAWIWGCSKKVTGFVPTADGMVRLRGSRRLTDLESRPRA